MNQKTLEYFNGDNLAASVFTKKYAATPDETPDQLHHRLAKEFAKIELKYKSQYNHERNKGIMKAVPDLQLSHYGKKRQEEIIEADEIDIGNKFYNLFKNFNYIIPAGSVMSGVGTDQIISYANCFVVQSPEDSIEGIFNSLKDIAQIFKRRKRPPLRRYIAIYRKINSVNCWKILIINNY